MSDDGIGTAAGGIILGGLLWLTANLVLGALVAYVAGAIVVAGVIALGVVAAPVGVAKVVILRQTGRLKSLAQLFGGLLAGSVVGTPLLLLLASYAFKPLSGGSGDVLPPGFLPAVMTLIAGSVFFLLTYAAPVGGLVMVSLYCWSGDSYNSNVDWAEVAGSVVVGAGIPLGILQWGAQLNLW